MEQIKKMNKVMVLMSTYNGEKYLEEQIDSILAQKGIEVKLIIRDDGSKDSTCEIIHRYIRKYTNIILYERNNVGFVKSFSELVKLGLQDSFSSDYYAFSDQDDIWHVDKLQTACKALSLVDKSLPSLYMSNSMKIDVERRELGLFVKCRDSQSIARGSALIHGSVQGCGMVFNKRAAELFNSIPPQNVWHDRWLFLICFYLGKVVYNNTPLFYYRMHGCNTLAKKINLKEYVEKQLRSFFKKPLHLAFAEEFYAKFSTNISTYDKKLFKLYFSYRYNLLSKIKILYQADFLYPYNKGLFLYICKVLLGRV